MNQLIKINKEQFERCKKFAVGIQTDSIITYSPVSSDLDVIMASSIFEKKELKERIRIPYPLNQNPHLNVYYYIEKGEPKLSYSYPTCPSTTEHKITYLQLRYEDWFNLQRD